MENLTMLELEQEIKRLKQELGYKEGLTLENLPKATELLIKEVSEIKQLILKMDKDKQVKHEEWLNLDDLCKYHPDNPTKQTVYGWVHGATIPVHKSGKKLRFLKSEIDNWLKQGRKKTILETDKEADQYILKKSK